MSTAMPIADESVPIVVPPSDWHGVAGDRWAANVDHQETMLASVADALMAHAAFAPGERVVEIGCGGGALTRRIAAAVAPGGAVTGLDISTTLVSLATARAARDGLDDCGFVQGDAQVAIPAGAPFDRLTSRFGIMFFADPAAAMTNLHSMLRPGGRLDVAVWAPAADNPMFTILTGAVRAHLAVAPPLPHAPGPLAFAETDYFGGLLTDAGFSAVRFEMWRGHLHVGHGNVGLPDVVRRMLAANSIADTLAQAKPEARDAVYRDVEVALRDHVGPHGVSLPASVHLVSAIA